MLQSETEKPWTVLDATVYNALAMGVIFPWAYLWGPAIFPGANVRWAIFGAFLAQVPISVLYSLLASRLPVNGGDYVYQTQVLGKRGFVIVFSGFVIWILQWVALAGWLFSSLGIAPLLISLGVAFRNKTIATLGLLAASPPGILLDSLLLAVVTVLFLNSGIVRFIRLQRFLFALTCASVLAVIIVFLQSPALTAQALNRFISTLVGVLGIHVPLSLKQNFMQYLQDTAQLPSEAPHSVLLATFAVVPIAWTSFQWATYSVEQGNEIRDAASLRSQLVMFVGSAAFVASMLIAIAATEQRALGQDFLAAVASSYWNGASSRHSNFFLHRILQPFPSVIAMAAAPTVAVSVIIGLGFLANAFQIACNCFIGVSRIVAQMARDGILPAKILLPSASAQDPFARINWTYFFLSIPVILGYSLLRDWTTYTLGVTFACGYVFFATCWAGSRLLLSGNGRVPPLLLGSAKWVLRIICASSVGISGGMVLAYLLVPGLGLRSVLPLSVVVAVILLSHVIARVGHVKGHGVATPEAEK